MALGIGYLVAMTASMGLQQLKSWQDNKQSEKLVNKQLEIKKALQNREFERLRRLQREAHEIAMEMEKEAHLQRREDIEKEYDNAFESLASQAELDKWPLNVVPFIMKGESFGSHIRGFDVATVHCILTPSNNMNFNRWIYGKLDMRIEELLNSYWNSNTTHPIVYYGGSWKSKPNGVPKFDYNDVTRLHTALNSIPVIAITPYFTPHGKFIVRVWCWGMGAENEDNQQSITPPTDLFSCEINIGTEYDAKDAESGIEKKKLIEKTISELSSYFVSMIGYLNDMYYWKMYKIPPHGISIFKSLGFKRTIGLYESSVSQITVDQAIHEQEFVKGIIPYVENSEDLITNYIRIIKSDFDRKKVLTIDEIKSLKSIIQIDEKKSLLNDLITIINNSYNITNVDFEVMQICDFDIMVVLDEIRSKRDSFLDNTFFYLCVWNSNILFGRFGQEDFTPTLYESSNNLRYFILKSGVCSNISGDTSTVYKINLSTNKVIEMEKNFEKRYGHEFARIGKGIGRILDALGQSKPDNNDSVWNGTSEKGDPKGDQNANEMVEQLLDMCTERISSQDIQAEYSENLTLQSFLDWIDKNYKAGYNKAHIVKGYIKSRGKYLFCIFFADDNKIYLGKNDPAKCFISPVVNQEMSETFGNNNICTIPLN